MLGLALPLCLTANARDPRAAVSAVRAVRPAVTLFLQIDTGYIRDKMNDDDCSGPCEQLRASMVDTLRQVLAARFPFLEWQTSSTSDTVELTWMNAPAAGILGSRLRFQLRGEGAVLDSDRVIVDFEKRDVFNARDDWTPDAMRPAWLARIPAILATGDVLTQVIGRVPFHPPITFIPPPRRLAHIDVMPESLRAAPDVPPMFEVRVHVLQAPDIDEDAMIPLRECTRAPVGYSCEINQVRFPRLTINTPGSLDSLFRMATIKAKLAHVIAFVPGTSAQPILP